MVQLVACNYSCSCCYCLATWLKQCSGPDSPYISKNGARSPYHPVPGAQLRAVTLLTCFSKPFLLSYLTLKCSEVTRVIALTCSLCLDKLCHLFKVCLVYRSEVNFAPQEQRLGVCFEKFKFHRRKHLLSKSSWCGNRRPCLADVNLCRSCQSLVTETKQLIFVYSAAARNNWYAITPYSNEGSPEGQVYYIDKK